MSRLYKRFRQSSQIIRSATLQYVNILVILAGNNEPSNGNMLADAFIEGMRPHPNLVIEKRKLKDLNIDHFHLGHYEDNAIDEPDFRMLKDLILQADGIIIATPVWNFSVPAHLKNLIDRMGAFGLNKETRSRGTLKKKPFYVIYTGGAPTIAWKGLMRITTSHVIAGIHYFDGSYLGAHCEPKCIPSRGKFGLVVDQRPQSITLVKKKGAAFARAVQRFKDTGKIPFKRVIVRKILKMGEAIVEKF